MLPSPNQATSKDPRPHNLLHSIFSPFCHHIKVRKIPNQESHLMLLEITSVYPKAVYAQVGHLKYFNVSLCINMAGITDMVLDTELVHIFIFMKVVTVHNHLQIQSLLQLDFILFWHCKTTTLGGEKKSAENKSSPTNVVVKHYV